MKNNILGKRLKMLREEANMSRAELALQLNTSIPAISQYENGARTPSDDIKICISKLFDVSLDYLMGLTPIRNGLSAEEYHLFMADLTEEDYNEINDFIQFLQSKKNK